MLRPVELDPTGNPRSGQPNEGRFDDVVVIDEMVSIGLVEGHVHPTAEFRQDHDLEIAVLQEYGFVGFVEPVIEDTIDDRMRIDDTAAALVNAFLQKHRVAIGFTDAIGWNDDVLFPDGYLVNAHIASL